MQQQFHDLSAVTSKSYYDEKTSSIGNEIKLI